MAPPRVVLVAVDESAHSAHAWAWAADSLLPCLLREGTTCVLACVAPPLPVDALVDVGDAPWVAPTDAATRVREERAAREAAEDTLARLLAAHPAPQGMAVKCVAAPMAGASAGETIAALQRQHGAELVVLGSRGMGAVKRCARASRESASHPEKLAQTRKGLPKELSARALPPQLPVGHRGRAGAGPAGLGQQLLRVRCSRAACGVCACDVSLTYVPLGPLIAFILAGD
jgi:nucleotide-binding universal stress UspA family protein